MAQEIKAVAFSFESLEIWQESIKFCHQLYPLMRRFPEEEQDPLGGRLRKTALSVSNTIAQGAGSSSKLVFNIFLDDAMLSVNDTVSILRAARDSGHLSAEEFNVLFCSADQMARKIKAFRNSL